jgi:hypothetical protein
MKTFVLLGTRYAGNDLNTSVLGSIKASNSDKAAKYIGASVMRELPGKTLLHSYKPFLSLELVELRPLPEGKVSLEK